MAIRMVHALNTIDSLKNFWEEVCKLNRLTSNDYRILIDIALNGEITQKNLCTKRGWKVSSVSNTVRRLEGYGLLRTRAEQGSIYYFVNADFKAEKGEK